MNLFHLQHIRRNRTGRCPDQFVTPSAIDISTTKPNELTFEPHLVITGHAPISGKENCKVTFFQSKTWATQSAVVKEWYHCMSVHVAVNIDIMHGCTYIYIRIIYMYMHMYNYTYRSIHIYIYITIIYTVYIHPAVDRT